MTARKKPTAAKAKKKCDVLFSAMVRSLGYCQRCNTDQNLQCAHIIGRVFAHTRTDRANAYCLCAKDHMHFHAYPDEWMEFVDTTIGRAEYDRLKAKAQAGVRVKFDWFAELERLKALHAELVP